MSLKKQLEYFLWVEKFRPTKVQEVLLPPTLKKYFMQLVEQKEIPNLLFHSSAPGVGKTTMAWALASDIGADTLYINTSSEGNIDTLRTRISKFAATKSMFGSKIKIVILDEADGGTMALFNGLRAAMEEFHNSCRFILTCNTLSRIPEPLQSRCQIVDFNLTAKDVAVAFKPVICKRLAQLLDFEKVSVQDGVLAKVVDSLYPDIRRMLNLLHQYTQTKGSIDEGIFSFTAVDQEFYELLLDKKFLKARQYAIEHNYNYHEMYRALYKEFIPLVPRDKMAQAILVVAEYQKWSYSVPDPELNFAACLLEIISILPVRTP
jgi:replication factor C small subunit